ncbi:DUF1742-domain-containing protein [Auriscalpium vulgare]|uniref:DUF1742-domain-containing protein n=1 Tax=Auriscalpium vulgare TaxID=40419 RepID=A0ACB8RUM0_9AGAM|nr:DUF1742-domain-containing protein [Auriscalpium vulgare]
MSFPNLYYKRATATPKPCYICFQPTTTVLATAVTTDFIYTCDKHLSDPGFATQLGDNADGVTKKAEPRPEEIAKIKEEWEARQKRKEKAATQKKDGGQENEKPGDGEKSPSPSIPGSLSSPTSPGGTTPLPRHQRFALHRDYFALRLAEHKKKKQAKQMQELAPRLPGAPRGSLS